MALGACGVALTGGLSKLDGLFGLPMAGRDGHVTKLFDKLAKNT